jgi:hypothetical protein
MDNLINALGTLGAYFAILLVLAVAVETILDPFTAIFGSLKKKVNPEDLMKDLKEWGSQNTPHDQIVQNVFKTMKAAKAVTKAAETITADQALDDQKLLAELQAMRDHYANNEQKRIVILRVVSAVIGIAIALLLHIDTFALLADLLPKDAQSALALPLVQLGGMVLTGLAASAGSSFWHDQLGKVRAVKEAAQQVQS